MAIVVNRAPVLTLWAAVVAERLGHSRETALTLGRAVAGSTPRVKARGIGREEKGADQDAGTLQLAKVRTSPAVMLFGKTIRMMLTATGEPRAAVIRRPADHLIVEHYLTKAFGDHLTEVRTAMEQLADRYEPAELDRMGLGLYEKFRPWISPGNEGLSRKAELEIGKILAAT